MSNRDKLPLTEMQEAFLNALIYETGGNVREAMRIAGYSDNTRPTELLKSLKEEIIERTQLMLAFNAPKAAYGLVNVVDDPSALGARNAVAAAASILDRVGVVKKEQVQVESKGQAMFILPPKSKEPDDESDT